MGKYVYFVGFLCICPEILRKCVEIRENAGICVEIPDICVISAVFREICVEMACNR